MSRKIFIGYDTGCWVIIDVGLSMITKGGTLQAQWKLRCLNCHGVFEVDNRRLKRRISDPKSCPNCKPPKAKRDNTKVTIHSAELLCRPRNMYIIKTTTDESLVTCKSCIKVKLSKG